MLLGLDAALNHFKFHWFFMHTAALLFRARAALALTRLLCLHPHLVIFGKKKETSVDELSLFTRGLFSIVSLSSCVPSCKSCIPPCAFGHFLKLKPELSASSDKPSGLFNPTD